MTRSVLPFHFREKEVGCSFSCSEDNYKFILYELFLYTLAAFIKAQRHEEARLMLDHQYYASQTFQGQQHESFSFTEFNDYAESLEGKCALRGNTRRISVMGDLLHDRASRKDLRFGDLLQADVICCLAMPGYCGWFPRSLVYSQTVGKLELFSRAVDEKGFRRLKTLLKCNTPEEMIARICSEEVDRICNSREMWRSVSIAELLNLKELKRRWMPEALS